LSGRQETKCPHCRGPAKIRSSESITPLYRVLYFQCLDITCGHTYRAELTILETLVPSARPNPAIKLPLSSTSAARRAARPA
jgi:hypothetical protein